METITLLKETQRIESSSSVPPILQTDERISALLETALFPERANTCPVVNTPIASISVPGDEMLAEFLSEGEPVILSLSTNGFQWRSRTKSLCGKLALADIIAISHEGPRSNRFCLGLCMEDQLYKLCIHTFERNCRKTVLWKLHVITFASSDLALVMTWVHLGQRLLSKLECRPKNLWVFVNPVGGSQLAPSIWQNQVKPLFEMASIHSKLVITKEAEEAQNLVKTATNEALVMIDGIVAVGGDGLFQEIMNGLLQRSHEPWTDSKAVNRTLRLGHIPAGSTDAVAWSINGSRCPVSSAMRIIFGDRMSLDVMKIESEECRSSNRYSACLAGYGFMGDVISISEHLRFFGPLRYDIAGMMAFFSHSSHKATISFQKAHSDKVLDLQGVHRKCHSACQWCEAALIQQEQEQDHGDADDDTQDDMQVIEDEFISIMIMVNPCRSDKTPHGLTPNAHLSDGRLHLVLVKTCPRWKYFSFLLSAAKHGVIPGQYPFVQTFDVKSVKVEPLDQHSSWNIDGEMIRNQSLTSSVHNGLIQVFARGIEF